MRSGRFGYLRQRLCQHRLLDVPALHHVLGAALELLQGDGERLLIDREQVPGHGLLSRHDHAEPTDKVVPMATQATSTSRSVTA